MGGCCSSTGASEPQQLGGLPGPDTAEEKRARAAAAAEARQAGNENRAGSTGISGERQQLMRHDAQRQELIGKIEAKYQALGQDAPVGLRAASLEALRKRWNGMRS